MAADLRGAGVLVTRPAHQAGPLCALIRARGGVPIRFPALAIEPPADPARADALFARLADYAIAIFISPNAVEFGLRRPGTRPWPPATAIAAVGNGSARALAAAGLPATLVPGGRYDSEALLALPRLRRVAGERILIVRGEGGRALLGETLAARGARVDYAEVYRRTRPQADAAALLARRDTIDVVTATSAEALENLFALLGATGADWLRRTPLVAISERMAESARALGIARVEVATRADDASVVEAAIRARG